MGCWNGTCMISNLPIISGEKIKLVLLQSGYNPNVIGHSGYVYSNEVLAPAFLPISGEYNDYGGIENIIEDWNYKIVDKYLKTKFGKILEIDGDVNDDWELIDFIDGIERGEPKYKVNEDFTKCNLSSVMIRQDIWDVCVTNQSNGGEFWNEDKYDAKDDDTIPYHVNGNIFFNRHFDKFIESLGGKYFRSEYVFAGHGEGRSMMCNSDYIEYCIDERNKLSHTNTSNLLDVRKQWIEHRLIESCVSNLRKGWMIQPGGGSQHAGWNEHIALSKSIIEICERKLYEEE